MRSAVRRPHHVLSSAKVKYVLGRRDMEYAATIHYAIKMAPITEGKYFHLRRLCVCGHVTIRFNPVGEKVWESVQKWRNSSAYALELRLFCTAPLNYIFCANNK